MTPPDISYKMVEFNFNISSIFPEEISIIGNDLIPHGHSGDINYVFLKQKVSWETEKKVKENL